MEPVDWADGGPRSPRFGDMYFQADGLAESRAVFLAGAGLPHAWAGRSRFTVAELGFGTGLNLLATLQLWAATRPCPQARLAMMSIEAFAMSREDAARALRLWPELAALARPLLAHWPDGRRGRRRIAWPELGAVLDLVVDDALPAVEGWDGRADAWFLDGFAPAANPAMWRPDLLAAVAARTAPGGRIASFTVAGAVRRALADAGLDVAKRPGFGRKRERLEAQAPGLASGLVPADPPAPRVVVIGGGIAAAALMRALRAEGVAPLRIDAPGHVAASANAAALVTPRLDAGPGAAARLHAEAFARAVTLYAVETPEAVIARGALQLARRPQDAERFARIAAWDGFAPASLRMSAPEASAAELDEAAAPAALHLADALVVEPAAVLARWLGPVAPGAVAAVAREAHEVVVHDATGAVLARGDAVVLACGAGLAPLLPGMDLRPTRGQATTAPVAFTGGAAAWGGYAIPTRDGVLFGATHARGDTDARARLVDDAANLRTLAQARPAFAARLQDAPLTGRAAVRLAAPDHLPLAGPIPGLKGVWTLGALGGRGFTLAPLLAEHVAAGIVGAPSPLAVDLAALVSPARMASR